MKTRIYLFTGFLDSGKTSFIQDTILNTDFCADEKSVLIVSEEGEVEYKREDIEALNCEAVYPKGIQPFIYNKDVELYKEIML